jgi:phosphoribosylformylglycinamidine (FGAM) synthase PurS component
MKRIILLSILSILLLSCSKYSEQIEVSKKKLLELEVTKQELAKYEFSVIEAFDKDIYNMIVDKYLNKAKWLSDLGENKASVIQLGKAKEYLNLMSKLKGEKTFYCIHAYRIAGDTLNDKTFFLDDKYNIIDFINKR